MGSQTQAPTHAQQPDESDQFIVQCDVAHVGGLDVSLVNGREPSRAVEYVIVQTTTVSGSFTDVNSPRTDMDVVVDATSVRLRFTGQPVEQSNPIDINTTEVRAIDR